MTEKLSMSSINEIANKIHGKNRKEFWRIYKNEGEEAAIEYSESMAAFGMDDHLRPDTVENQIFGKNIEEGALTQFGNASRIAPALKSALMPDAHQGYGLPIGGVLALDNAISPFAVGVDIGCRMCISIFPLKFGDFLRLSPILRNALIKQTRFGMGCVFASTDKGGLSQHEVIDDRDWEMFKGINKLSGIQNTAIYQLGTSGGGNHFVEWGLVKISDQTLSSDLEVGETYLALLSHSGSRGIGAKIADYYSKLAMEQRPNLDAAVKHLAWFDMDTNEGQEYWKAMNLAGKFAEANHHVIHNRVSNEVGIQAVLQIENHHNFAWIENIQMTDGTIKEAYVHRKGATPAGDGVLGIIPGSMATNGYIVKGKGNPQSMNSASHGAGRAMSRTKAIENISLDDLKKLLTDADVDLIGSGNDLNMKSHLDEAPQAYKDIEAVMALQTDLVDIVGTFQPKIVRMADDGFRED